MITEIAVDGFRSLSKFRLLLKPGLNILVGPNGAGKTNIIVFFEFLSLLARNEISEGVSRCGGAGLVFQKIGEDDYKRSIDVTVYGTKKTKNNYTVYEYSFTIELSVEDDLIFYSKQRIRTCTAKRFVRNPRSFTKNMQWDLDIEQTKKGDLPVIEVKHIDLGKFRSGILGLRIHKLDKAQRTIAEFIESYNPLTYSIIYALQRMFRSSFNILPDFYGAESFNIIPSRVRMSEDTAKLPGIQKDGSGLATTLYFLKKKKSQATRVMRVIRTSPLELPAVTTGILAKIIDYAKLANPAIQNIDVTNDAFNDKLIVKTYIDGGGHSAVLPLSAMSDGTLKWLALIAAVLTSPSIFSIEEPENYLHPWMQAEIVRIMRSSFEDKRERSLIIMTTHSESLMNYAEPSELIIVSMKKGRTQAVRVKNSKQLSDEISKTGFGLGQIYFANALSDE